MMHQLVPRELLGRVTSLDWLVSTSLMPLSMTAVGSLGDGIGARATLVLAGLLASTITLVSVVAIPRVREPERDVPGALSEPMEEPVEGVRRASRQ
jgi:hypothetical protein